jgi:prepilin-type N-terminal cleavage/methylation domain-containing protein
MSAMHWKNRRGFSLVELAVVLVVAGLVLAIAAPGVVRHLNAQKVRDAARTLADEMRLARQKAVSNGTRNYVYTQWGVTQNEYWTGVSTQLANGTWTSPLWRGPIALQSRTRQVGANFSNYVYFFYDPSGRPRQPIGGLNPPASSGSIKVISTVPSVTDTAVVNLDLTGSVW